MPRTRVDYADYNITVYRSCPYGCVYCWAWRIPVNRSRIERGGYDPVNEARRIAKKARRGERVVVSFTSDPYPYEEMFKHLTKNVLLELALGEVTVMVLTKNPLLALRDFEGMKFVYEDFDRIWLGTTVTCGDITGYKSPLLEPNAPRTDLRLRALREWVEHGGKVWISLEPIIPIDEVDYYPLNILIKAVNMIGEGLELVVLGRLNYINQLRKAMNINISEERARKFYREHVPTAIDYLRNCGIKYYVKKELRKVLEE